MNNDLISREALKKAIEKYRPKSAVASLFIDGEHCMFMNCTTEIDNAPTVEYPFYQEAYQKIDEARKVIWDTSLPDACKVMKLRKLIDYECGAEMKGGAE